MRPTLALIAVLFLGCCSTSSAQDPLDAIAVADIAPSLGEPTQASLVGFRKALISSAEQACKAGEISRVEMFKLRVATLNGKVLKQMHQAVAEQVLSDGKAKSFGAIDWPKLMEVIKELLPIILQIIALFA